MEETRRRAYLRALGIDLWLPRGMDASALKEVPEVGAGPSPTLRHATRDAPTEHLQKVPHAHHEVLDDARAPGPSAPEPRTPIFDPAVVARVAGVGWDELEATVADCRLCTLCEGRSRTVFGTGNREADWLVVGEAPGAEEDRRGEPFVGPAGKLLDQMLRAVGLSRPEVYIANTLKCRPPRNRDPNAAELGACRPYLERQVALLRPRLVLAVGRISAQALLGSDAPIGRLRGQVLELPGTGIPLVATYHPAYLLRSPEQKRRAWQDLLLARGATVTGADGGRTG